MAYKIKKKQSKFEIIPKNKYWIIVNMDDSESIEQAEKLKFKAENLGYHQIKTEQIGLNKFKLIYKKS